MKALIDFMENEKQAQTEKIDKFSLLLKKNLKKEEIEPAKLAEILGSKDSCVAAKFSDESLEASEVSAFPMGFKFGTKRKASEAGLPSLNISLFFNIPTFARLENKEIFSSASSLLTSRNSMFSLHKNKRTPLIATVLEIIKNQPRSMKDVKKMMRQLRENNWRLPAKRGRAQRAKAKPLFFALRVIYQTRRQA